MSGTFISYREDDAKPWALLLRDELVEAFGEQRVYLDKDALRAGNWHVQLQEALMRCEAVLVVMGRRWLSAQAGDGRRRLDDPGDVHRREIATALARKGTTVIPVLVDGATMPHPEELPDDIRGLVEQQARSLGDRSAHRQLDLAELIKDIERVTGLVASTLGYPEATRRSWPAWLGGFAAMAISIYIGLEIDFRHWSWILFLLVVPAAVVSLLALQLRRARARRSRDRRKAR